MGAVGLSSGVPPDRAPQGDELHVRLIDLRQAADSEARLRGFLSHDEIERAGRFHLGHARARFVLTRGWLRVVLARCLDFPPGQLVFSYGANGKPALAAQSQERLVSFSVSHSGDYALMGLTARRAIGVDIEQFRPIPGFASMASGYFSADETRAIMERPEPDRLRAFLKCWTRKEAFMKATGDGMAIALDAFTVTLDDDDEPGISMRDAPAPQGASGEAWTVRGLSLVAECEAAVAVQGAAAVVTAWRDPVLI